MRSRTKILSTLFPAKATLLLLLFLLSFASQAQFNPETDTVIISEIVISPGRLVSNHNGFKSFKIDSSLVSQFNTGSLSDLISNSTSLFLKSYGGALSTPSFRGSGASHTIVSWNGININSPMTGQSDFSTIPVSTVNEIEVSYGAASMSKFSGAFGGNVNLLSRPLYYDGFSATIAPATGSFGKRYLHSIINAGNNKFQSQTALSLSSADNDFQYNNKYIGPETVVQKRLNNQSSGYDLSQDLWLRQGNLEYSANLWYSFRNRNLPGTMLTSADELNESQRDKSFRGLIMVRSLYSPVKLTLKSSISALDLLYINRLSSIESLNNSFTWQTSGEIKTPFTQLGNLTISANEELSRVKSVNYKEITIRSLTALSIAFESLPDINPGLLIMLREQVHNGKFQIPDIAIGTEYKFLKKPQHSLHASIARNSRIPTMNDLFWYPGGNMKLKNETAWLYETGYEYKGVVAGHNDFNVSINYFLTRSENLIQWLPGMNSYWSPENINSTLSQGIEASVQGNINYRSVKIIYNAGYSYTSALNMSDPESDLYKRQLIYTPKHAAFGRIEIERRNICLMLINDFTGKRFITPENTKSMDPYNLISFGAKYRVAAGKNLAEIGFKIMNLLNAEYQSVAYYPEAGRSFIIDIKYTFNNYK